MTTISSTAFSGLSGLSVYFEMTQSEVLAESGISLDWAGDVASVEYGLSEVRFLTTTYPLDTSFEQFLFTLNNQNGTASVRTSVTTIWGEVEIPAYILHAETSGETTTYSVYEVTSISNGSGDSSTSTGGFVNCTDITSVILPETITSISTYAFANCTSLESISVQSGLQSISGYAFYNCTALESFDMPDSVQSLGYYAFYNCTSLASCTLSKSLTVIQYCTFKNCSSLTHIDLPAGLTEIQAQAFNATGLTEVIIPEGVTEMTYTTSVNGSWIMNGEFAGCKSLVTVYFPDTMTYLSRSFEQDSVLENIYTYTSWTDENGDGIMDADELVCKERGVLPSNLTGISWTFWGCSVLSEIYLHEGITTLANRSLCGTAITSITLPSTLTYLDDCVLMNCTKLETVYILGEITSIGDSALQSCSSLTGIYCCTWEDADGDGICEEDELVKGENGVLPSSVTSIGSSAFAGCSSLTELVIPTGVTSIGSTVFNACGSLTSITLPFVGTSSTESDASANTLLGRLFSSGTTTNTSYLNITQYYSSDEDSATKYYLPNSLTTVKVTGGTLFYGAFSNCTSITSIYIGADVTEIQNYAFYGLTDTTIYFELTEQEFNDAVTDGTLIIGTDWNVSGCTIVFGVSL